MILEHWVTSLLLCPISEFEGHSSVKPPLDPSPFQTSFQNHQTGFHCVLVVAADVKGIFKAVGRQQALPATVCPSDCGRVEG